MVAMSFFLFRDYYLVAIMLYREYPEKSFKSFSLLANALPIGIPAEGLGLGILQPEIGILQPDWYSSDSWGIGFPEGYFPAETFHNAYPSAGMPMGRARGSISSLPPRPIQWSSARTEIGRAHV